MRPMLLQPAKFNEGIKKENIDGINSLNFSFVPKAEMNEFFSQSCYEIVSMLGRYDVCFCGTVNENEIFCVYHKRNQEEEIKKVINDIINGQTDLIINEDGLLLYPTINHINYSANKDYEFYGDDTIWWDVNNNMIIVIGRENIKKLLYVLETEAYRSFANHLNKPTYSFINDDNLHILTKKIVCSSS